MTAKTIVIVDDEENVGASLRLVLEGAGYAVAVCHSGADFKRRLARAHADAYLLDVRLPDANGIDLLPLVADQRPQAPVIMISGHATIADAVAATRAGAFDFLEKPLGRDRILLVLKNALEQAALAQENARLRELVGDAPRMIGSSAAFRRVVEQATRVAQSDARVLLTGESGTGKELLAAHMHRNSPFAAGPFVKVNCAAIPVDLLESELFGHEKGAFTGATASRRGKFELADGGTIFLDEVRDLHEASQAKLLRVLQEGEFQRVGGEQTRRVTVRVISATNQDLSALVAEKKIPRGSLLPAERRPDPRAAAEGAARGHPAARRVLRRRVLPPQQLQAEAVRRRSVRRARGVSVAGQHPRASERRWSGWPSSRPIRSPRMPFRWRFGWRGRPMRRRRSRRPARTPSAT